MKNKYFLFLIFICFLCIPTFNASSLTYRIKIKDNGTNLRKGPGTNYEKINSLEKFDYYMMVNENTYKDENNHHNCNGDWYYITYYSGVNGYVCSDNVEVISSYSKDDVAPSNECETALKNAGFPSSYWGGLCQLKSNHPNWNFEAINTNLDWEYVIKKESECGANYIHKGTYDKTFFDSSCTNTSPGGYIAPSKTALAYYMDPRNFFTEKFLFQFLNQSYDETLENVYPTVLNSILNGASFYNYHTNLGNDLSQKIINASKTSMASPIFIASRIRQELGTKDSLYNLYSGVYTGNDNKYYGYYNFFNFGVSDSCVSENGTTYCGLNYALKKNWNGLDTAIDGGTSQLAASYINKGQYTGYLQKYNVVPTDKNLLFIHQYMTNVAAPMSESKTTYNAYVNNNLIDLNLKFSIPVYTNMTSTIVNSNSGAVGDDIEGNISSLPIHTIVTSSGYRYESDYITNIKPETTIATLKGSIESVGGNNTVVIKDNKGNIVTDDIVKTGYVVSINNNNSTEELTIVIKGDTSGDGIINALDLLQVQKNILGSYNLDGAYKKAGDTSNDDNINALDLLQVQKNILGSYEISQ